MDTKEHNWQKPWKHIQRECVCHNLPQTHVRGIFTYEAKTKILLMSELYYFFLNFLDIHRTYIKHWQPTVNTNMHVVYVIQMNTNNDTNNSKRIGQLIPHSPLKSPPGLYSGVPRRQLASS